MQIGRFGGLHCLFVGSLTSPHAHDRAEGGLRLDLTVEEKRVLGVPPGEGVQPASPVVEVPERHSPDRVGAFAEQSKQVGLLSGLPLEQVGGASAGQRVGLLNLGTVLAAVGPPASAGDDA
jgi:hypothetical protein